MPFCEKCGSELSTGANFCSTCGNPVYPPSVGFVGREKTEGSIHKCPSCGAALDAFSERCESCGYQLRSVGAPDSVVGLARKLEAEKDCGARATLVKSFPVPNTKEDLIEFLIMSVSNIDEASPYGSKDEEMLTKA